MIHSVTILIHFVITICILLWYIYRLSVYKLIFPYFIIQKFIRLINSNIRIIRTRSICKKTFVCIYFIRNHQLSAFQRTVFIISQNDSNHRISAAS